MERDLVIRSMLALWQSDDVDATPGFLFAAAYLQAILADVSPRTVAEDLFRSFPTDEEWPAVRASFLAMLEGEAGTLN